MPIQSTSGLLRRLLPLAVIALGGVVTGMVAAQDGTAKTEPLRLSVAQAPAFPLGWAADRWLQIVNAESAGGNQLKLYPGATLAQRDPARELAVLKDGGADLAVGSALAWSAQVPALAVVALPWLAPDARDVEALVGNLPLRSLLFARLEAAGVVALAMAPLAERVLATARAPVQTPTELAGMKIRAMANPLVQDSLTALGALPQAMSFAEAQAAFQAGRLDGQEGAPSTLAAMRVAALGQRFVTRWGAFSDVMLFAVRRNLWDSWTQEQQARVRTAAQSAAAEAGALAREDAALAELTRQGVTIARLSPVQRAQFRAAVAPVWALWSTAIGKDVIDAAEAAVAAGNTGPK